MVLPLETVLMRHLGLWYCSARALTLEGRGNLGMKRDELWTAPLLDECRRLYECNKGCYKLSPRALSLMSLASGVTATMKLLPPPGGHHIAAATHAVRTVSVMDVADAAQDEEEAKLVKEEQEEWRKILKPSLGKIKKSKRNKLPPPTAKRTTTTTKTAPVVVSKDVNQVTHSNGKNIQQQIRGESSTEGESDSNNDMVNDNKEFPIAIIQFPLAENNSNTSSSSSDTKKSKSSSSKKKSSSTSKTAKPSSSKKTTTTTTMKVSTSSSSSKVTKKIPTSSSTKKVVVKKAVAEPAATSSSAKKKEVKKTAAAPAVKKESSASASTTKQLLQDSASVRQRTACIKAQGKQIFARMVSPIPATHWSSPMYV
jgi:hypothetical protein